MCFWVLWSWKYIFLIIRRNTFRGDISAKKIFTEVSQPAQTWQYRENKSCSLWGAFGTVWFVVSRFACAWIWILTHWRRTMVDTANVRSRTWWWAVYLSAYAAQIGPHVADTRGRRADRIPSCDPVYPQWLRSRLKYGIMNPDEP